MIRTTFAAAASALLFAAAPTAAQNEQEQLDARYDRALAAGYKALFLCGAIANAERAGVSRTPESVEQWELTGVYARIAPIIDSLEYRILRDAAGQVAHVEVNWADDMPPRFAAAEHDTGCRLAPIGLTPSMPETRVPEPDKGIVGALAGKILNLVVNGSDQSSDEQSRASRVLAGPYAPVFDAALANGYGEGTRTTALIVSQGDRMTERYVAGFEDTPQRTWSVAKSIAATLVGVAVHQGRITVNDQVARDAWRWDARRQITIDHLLRMASGRYSDTPGNRTDPLYAGGGLVEETATDWPLLYRPGTVYRYANNDTLMAIKAISDRRGDFDPAAFFKRTGMHHTVAETDWAGDYILSSQVWTTARDLAKFGQLYLNDGVLPDGTRILPEGWVEYVSSPSGPQPEGRNIGYGAGFWLFNQNEGIPADTFAAMGNRGQFVVIVPSRDVVIVRRGEDPAGARFDILAFTRDVLAALED